MGRIVAGRCLVLLVVASGLNLALAGASSGRTPRYVPPGYTVPEFSAEVGKKFAGAGVVVQGNCKNFVNVVIHWGDGSSGPADSVTAAAGGTTIAGSHTYASGGDYLGAVDLDATCTNNLGMEYTGHQAGNPGGYPLGFVVHVTCSGAQSANRPARASREKIHAVAAQEACVLEKKRFSPRQKKLLVLVQHAYAFDVTALGMAAAATSVALPPASAVLAFVGAMKGGMLYVVSVLASDPPDPNFRSVAQPRDVTSEHLAAKGRLTRADANRVNGLLTSLARTESLHEALLTAIERAQGATHAKQPAFEKRQMLAAAGFASQLARVDDELGTQSRDAERALMAAGITVQLGPGALNNAQAEISRNGLPRHLTREFDRLGRYGAQARRYLLAQTKLSVRQRTTWRFPQVLVSPDLLHSYREEADALRAFAIRTTADPLAPA